MRRWKQREDYSMMSLTFETAEAGSNILPGSWAVNQNLRGGTGACQEIKANSIIIYWLTMAKSFHSSALHRMRGRMGEGSCEKIKSVKNFNECNYWIISHIVHLLQSVPVTSEILTCCIAFLHSCNHIDVFKRIANDIHRSCPSLP